MGQGRVELPTSRLSGVRSNHLSYWPGTRTHGGERCSPATDAVNAPRAVARPQGPARRAGAFPVRSLKTESDCSNIDRRPGKAKSRSTIYVVGL